MWTSISVFWSSLYCFSWYSSKSSILSSTFCMFVTDNTTISVDFAGISAGYTKSTVSAVSVLSFSRIISKNLTQAWYSGDFSWKSISETKLFRLGFRSGNEVTFTWQLVVLSVGDSIEKIFVGDCTMSSNALMGIGFPDAPTRVDCIVRPEILVGCCFCFMLSGVFFSFILFGDGGIVSEVEDPESFDDNDVALSSCIVSDWNFIPLVCVLGAGLPQSFFQLPSV